MSTKYPKGYVVCASIEYTSAFQHCTEKVASKTADELADLVREESKSMQYSSVHGQWSVYGIDKDAHEHVVADFEDKADADWLERQLNVVGDLLEVVDLAADVSLYWTGEDEARIPQLKRLRTLAYAALKRLIGRDDIR